MFADDKKSDIDFILFTRRGKHTLAACRGQAKGCKVHREERRKLGPCPDCYVCNDPTETLESIYNRLKKGDA